MIARRRTGRGCAAAAVVLLADERADALRADALSLNERTTLRGHRIERPGDGPAEASLHALAAAPRGADVVTGRARVGVEHGSEPVRDALDLLEGVASVREPRELLRRETDQRVAEVSPRGPGEQYHRRSRPSASRPS